VTETPLADRSPARAALQRRYFWALIALLFLFCLRVIGQILVAFFNVSFLPPMEEWFSGLLPYPELLTSQILILLLYGKMCLDFARGRGFFVNPRRRLGTSLLIFGSLYLGVMILRYIIRMSLYPHERWAGGCIPIFFHWVLSSFILVLGSYHWWTTAPSMKPTTGKRLVPRAASVVALLSVSVWVIYQIAPSLLAHQLGFRPSQFAVRTQKRARYKDKAHEKVETDHLDLPPDVANGVLLNLLKNIRPDTKETKLSYVGASPKPRLVHLSITPQGEETFSVAGARYKATRFRVKVEVGGIVGMLAPLIGKQPADTNVWVLDEKAPAFVKAEEALYMGGPIWSIEMASPVWPQAHSDR
jgi:hypothetical protein